MNGSEFGVGRGGGVPGINHLEKSRLSVAEVGLRHFGLGISLKLSPFQVANE